MKNRTLTYRFLTGFFLILFTGSIFGSHLTLNDSSKTATAVSKKEQKTPELKSQTQDALVQAQKVSVDITAFLFRNIETPTEVAHTTRLVQNLILPKILQTLFVSAIPKNAP